MYTNHTPPTLAPMSTYPLIWGATIAAQAQLAHSSTTKKLTTVAYALFAALFTLPLFSAQCPADDIITPYSNVSDEFWALLSTPGADVRFLGLTSLYMLVLPILGIVTDGDKKNPFQDIAALLNLGAFVAFVLFGIGIPVTMYAACEHKIKAVSADHIPILILMVAYGARFAFAVGLSARAQTAFHAAWDLKLTISTLLFTAVQMNSLDAALYRSASIEFLLIAFIGIGITTAEWKIVLKNALQSRTAQKMGAHKLVRLLRSQQYAPADDKDGLSDLIRVAVLSAGASVLATRDLTTADYKDDYNPILTNAAFLVVIFIGANVLSKSIQLGLNALLARYPGQTIRVSDAAQAQLMYFFALHLATVFAQLALDLTYAGSAIEFDDIALDWFLKGFVILLLAIAAASIHFAATKAVDAAMSAIETCLGQQKKRKEEDEEEEDGDDKA